MTENGNITDEQEQANDFWQSEIEFVNSQERLDYISELDNPDSPNYDPYMARRKKESDILRATSAIDGLHGDRSAHSYNAAFNNVVAKYFSGEDLQRRLLPTEDIKDYNPYDIDSCYGRPKPAGYR